MNSLYLCTVPSHLRERVTSSLHVSGALFLSHHLLSLCHPWRGPGARSLVGYLGRLSALPPANRDLSLLPGVFGGFSPSFSGTFLLQGLPGLAGLGVLTLLMLLLDERLWCFRWDRMGMWGRRLGVILSVFIPSYLIDVFQVANVATSFILLVFHLLFLCFLLFFDLVWMSAAIW